MKINIKRYISQKVIGHSEDGQETYLECLVEMSDSSTKQCWLLDSPTRKNIVYWQKPYIPRPQN